jgi:hypothetical protein
MESATFDRILALLAAGSYLVSRHAFKEAQDDGILITDLVAGIAFGEVVEDYPDFGKGPCALVLQEDGSGKPVHALWGIRKNEAGPAVLITCYRPDPAKWEPDFRRRRS